MSLNVQERARRRFNAAEDLVRAAVDKVERKQGENPFSIDLASRLLITPTFIWDGLVEAGLDRTTLKDGSFEAIKLMSIWQLTIDYLKQLKDACDPDSDPGKKRVIDLTSVSLVSRGVYREILLGLGLDPVDLSMESQNAAADSVLGYLSPPESLIARYKLPFIKGRARFPFDNLVDGGVRYFLPTNLADVRTCLTYPRKVQNPLVSLIVNPIS